MGMASFTEDPEKIRSEFRTLRSLFDKYFPSAADPVIPSILSMGMSGDFEAAIAAGSTLVRVGSALFGSR